MLVYNLMPPVPHRYGRQMTEPSSVLRVFDCIDDPLACLDARGRVIFWNRAIASFFGVSSDDAVGQPIQALLEGEEAIDWDAIRATAQAEGHWRGQMIHVAPDHERRWVDCSVNRLEIPGQAAAGLTVLIRDHGLQRQSERANERWARAARISRTGFLDWNIRTGEVVLCPSAQNIFGLSENPEPIPGQMVLDRVHPDDLEMVQEQFRLAAVGVSGSDLDHRIIRPDGEVTWVRSNAEVTSDEDGPARMLGTVIDITESVLVQEALQRSEERYRSLAETSQDLIWRCDLEGRFTYLNPAWEDALDYTLDEMIGRPFSDFKPSERTEPDLAKFSEIVGGDRSLGYETVYLSRSGERVFLRFNAVPILESGVVVGTQGTAFDITDLKSAETRMALMVRELDHRVKNTLAAVLALAQGSRAKGGTLDSFLESFTGRVRAMARAHEALAASRWQGMDLRMAAELILASYVEGAQHRLDMEGDPVMLPALAALPICGALHELATNAAKYGAFSQRTGRVELTWKREDGGLDIHWLERGGPSAENAGPGGLGTKMIEGFIAYELGGQVLRKYERSGASCHLLVPLSGETVGAT